MIADSKRRASRKQPSDLRSREQIARHAPQAWRTEQALANAGFARVRGGLAAAVRASRMKRLSHQMAALRRQAGLTQAQVANRMGTTTSVVSRMESGNPGNLTIATLERFARAVGAELRFTMVQAG